MNIELRWLKPNPRSKEDAILQYRQQFTRPHGIVNDYVTEWTNWITVPTMYDEKDYSAWKDKEPVS